MECPKCHYERKSGDNECPKCGIVYNKWEKNIAKNQEQEILLKENEPLKYRVETYDIGLGKYKYLFAGIIVALIIGALFKEHLIKFHPTPPKDTPQVIHKRELIIKEDSKEPLPTVDHTSENIERAKSATIIIKTPISQGSGFFITDDGYILTNKHVLEIAEKKREELFNRHDFFIKSIDSLRESVEELENTAPGSPYWSKYLKNKAQLSKLESSFKAFNDKYYMILFGPQLLAYLNDGTEIYPEFVSRSYNHDLVLLKVSGLKNLYIGVANIDQLKVGEQLYAIGSPYGLVNTVTKGMLSAKRGSIIQTSAQINPGNSGGPLITKDGKVVGINTFQQLGKDGAYNFAISIDVAIKEFDHYLNYLTSN